MNILVKPGVKPTEQTVVDLNVLCVIYHDDFSGMRILDKELVSVSGHINTPKEFKEWWEDMWLEDDQEKQPFIKEEGVFAAHVRITFKYPSGTENVIYSPVKVIRCVQFDFADWKTHLAQQEVSE